MNTAATSPQKAIEMLDALVRLYGSEASADDGDERIAKGVQLAERQLVQLREDFAELNERRLSDLQERLATAERLASSYPEEANAIRQAIVDLYEDQPWASEIVSETRRAISTNESSND
jgi:hypothetical protein